MGHYDSCYEEEYRKAREAKRETLLELSTILQDLMASVRRSGYYNENSHLYIRLQEALFWLKNDIP